LTQETLGSHRDNTRENVQIGQRVHVFLGVDEAGDSRCGVFDADLHHPAGRDPVARPGRRTSRRGRLPFKGDADSSFERVVREARVSGQNANRASSRTWASSS